MTGELALLLATVTIALIVLIGVILYSFRRQEPMLMATGGYAEMPSIGADSGGAASGGLQQHESNQITEAEPDPDPIADTARVPDITAAPRAKREVAVKSDTNAADEVEKVKDADAADDTDLGFDTDSIPAAEEDAATLPSVVPELETVVEVEKVEAEPPLEPTAGDLAEEEAIEPEPISAPAEANAPEPEILDDIAEKSIEDAIKEAQQVQFATYYPREVALNEWQPLIAYVYKLLAADAVAENASKELGDLAAAVRHVVQSSAQEVRIGATITATPHLEGFQFNPPSVSVGFFETWHRFDFKLRATDAPLNSAANGYLTFTVEGVIVADIPLSIFVGETVEETETTVAAVHPYPAIFASYSHDDTHIVERVERAYQALGMDYLRDVYALKSGQDWDDQVLALIEQADIFQLFWSTTAAASPYVRQEWEHALKLNEKNVHFIRPVYWEEPMPPAPDPLSSLHFAYQPELDD